MQTPQQILQQYWHYNSFRPLQEEIIFSVLEGKDTLAILPTGGGKSVCYQIPALILDGSCLVISPLIALIKDQATSLTKKGISCLVVTSSMSPNEIRIAYEKMCSGEYKFLFVSPERLQSKLFLDYLQQWKISLLAVDEAHCISQWGYDFRPAYLAIELVKKYIPTATTIALTASATEVVKNDIIEKLALKNQVVFFSTFYRKNISLSCLLVENKMVKAIDILKKINASSLVYCKNRRTTQELAQTFLAQGIQASYYHAGLSHHERSTVQQNWIDGKTAVIVCTNAFGMGIDKSNVRLVLHFDMVDIPENYYQEVGRAGRDEQKAYAVLLYNAKNLKDVRNQIALKYPLISTIKNIYFSLANFFQLSVGEGENAVFDFDVQDFAKKFNFNILETISSLKILEQNNYLQFSESIFLLSRAIVIADKLMVAQYQRDNKLFQVVLDALIRTYGGIWSSYVVINEFLLAQKCNIAVDLVETILVQLHQLKVIEYVAKKDKPQLTFLQNRMAPIEFLINHTMYNLLKKRYQERVEFMIKYAENKTTCRAKLVVGFFDEMIEKDCEICDNCLAKKNTLTPNEFNNIKNTILQQLALKKVLNIEQFVNQFSSLKQEYCMKVIRYLMDENIIYLQNAEEIKLKNEQN